MRHTYLLLLLSSLGIACGSSGSPTTPPPPPPPPPPTPASITVTPGPLTLEVGEAGNLIAVVKDAGGAVLSASVSWSSGNAAVASVSSTGRVTALTQGDATITATSGTVTGTAAVTVIPAPVAAVALSTAPPELEVGRTTTLVATLRDARGAALTGRTIAWSSSNEAAATVSADGVIAATGQGATTITATSEGKSATSGSITVNTRAGFLKAIVDSFRTAQNFPAVGIAITTRTGTFGMAVAGKRRMSFPELATTNDLWHIGSNLKAITGHVAAIAVNTGALNWNTTIAQTYPEFAATILPEYQDVTLRMLLGHIGGIAANIEDQNIPGVGTLTVQRTNIAEWATGVDPAGPIGSFLYSNVGYVIAANMVERAMGVSWESIMTSNLLAPLGANAFGWGAAPWEQNQNPIGHRRDGGGWIENASDNPPYHSSAGRSHMSLAVWARIMQEILQADQGNSALVSQTNARTVTVPIAPGNGYAGGWFAGAPAWAMGRGLDHSGSNAWHSSMAAVALDRGAALVVVTNLADPSSDQVINALYALAGRLWEYYGRHGT